MNLLSRRLSRIARIIKVVSFWYCLTLSKWNLSEQKLALTDLLAYKEFGKNYPPPPSDLDIAIPLKRRHLKNKFFFFYYFPMLMAILLIFPKNKNFFFVLGALQGQIWQSWGRRSHGCGLSLQPNPEGWPNRMEIRFLIWH